MNLHIRPVSDNDIDVLVQIAIFAWPSVFRSFRSILGDERRRNDHGQG